MMSLRGLIHSTLPKEARPPYVTPWHYLSMRVVNPPAFVVATAYLIQSPDRSVAILCFRGTEPTNVINWLTDLTVSPESFLAGHVHGGIFRNFQAIWPLVDKALELVQSGVEVTDVNVQRMADAHSGKADGEGLLRTAGANLDTLKSLYVCGHSLGGAMAALAAANILTVGKYRSLCDKFRGVYTYGAPMVATPDLADVLDASIGHLVFRHVYKNDLVPRLPPYTTGRFRHFGREYACAGRGHGWSYAPAPARQSRSAFALAIGGLALVVEQYPLYRFLSPFFPLPYSLDQHSPRYYMSVSEASLDSAV